MKLRKPCIDGRYDPHWIDDPHLHPERDLWCPGGVFLPDDTLVIEKVDGDWPWYVMDAINETGNTEGFYQRGIALLDALAAKP